MGAEALDVTVDWFLRVVAAAREEVVVVLALRFALREPLGVVKREQKRHTLGLGAEMAPRSD